MKFFVLAVLIFLTGCAANPAKENDQSIQQFASNFSGKELRFTFPAPGLNVSNGDSIPSGARDPLFGYADRKEAYAPAYKYRKAEGGSLWIVDRSHFSKRGAPCPYFSDARNMTNCCGNCACITLVKIWPMIDPAVRFP
jgi:hypothetical protein